MDEHKLLAVMDSLVGRIAKSPDVIETNALAEACLRLAQAYDTVKAAQAPS